MPESLDEWLALLEARHYKPIDLGLERVAAVARQLDLAMNKVASVDVCKPTVITIAGTNGKGSTLAALEALINEATGLPKGVKWHRSTSINNDIASRETPRYGKYTSPHLLRFNERIVINGSPVSDTAICDAFKHVERARLSTQLGSRDDSVSLSYFEFTTLAAFYLFDQASLDYWLLEVGLGGRLDAVNIIDPDVAVITNIDLDHQAFLGDTLNAIGREKAGIARTNVPVLVADRSPPAGLLDELEKKKSLVTQVQAAELDIFASFDPLLDPAAWWAATEALKLTGFNVSAEQCQSLAVHTTLAGRLERREHHGRELLLDVAHNRASVLKLKKWLEKRPAEGNTFAIFAVMEDKDYAEMLAKLLGNVDYWLFTDLPVPRAASAEALAACLSELTSESDESVTYFGQSNFEPCFKCCNNMKTALNSAVQLSKPDDRIAIFGSFYTVAAALDVLEPH